jgi:hypothetical protein
VTVSPPGSRCRYANESALLISFVSHQNRPNWGHGGGPLGSSSCDLIWNGPFCLCVDACAGGMASIVKCTCANRYELRRRAGQAGRPSPKDEISGNLIIRRDGVCGRLHDTPLADVEQFFWPPHSPPRAAPRSAVLIEMSCRRLHLAGPTKRSAEPESIRAGLCWPLLDDSSGAERTTPLDWPVGYGRAAGPWRRWRVVRNVNTQHPFDVGVSHQGR